VAGCRRGRVWDLNKIVGRGLFYVHTVLVNSRVLTVFGPRHSICFAVEGRDDALF
jgi:hypothetical protein